MTEEQVVNLCELIVEHKPQLWELVQTYWQAELNGSGSFVLAAQLKGMSEHVKASLVECVSELDIDAFYPYLVGLATSKKEEEKIEKPQLWSYWLEAIPPIMCLEC